MARASFKNQAVANLFRDAMAAAHLTITDVVAMVPADRGAVGAIIRGETQRPDPQVLNAVCGKLGLAVLVVLEAYGYNVAVRPKDRIPLALADLWPRMSTDAQTGLLALARAAARPNSQEGEGAA